MSSVSAVEPDDHLRVRTWSPGARAGVWGALALVVLSLVETAQAVMAPLLTPSEGNWRAAGERLRAQVRPGDLIVAAPAWSDPLMRKEVGDLLPISAAARMDDARYGRLWVFSQGGAHAPEEATRSQTTEERFGLLTLRRFEGHPSEVTYDFLERWRDAYVTHWDPGTRAASPCAWQEDGFVCTQTGNSVRRALVEVDQQIRRALLAPPVPGGIIAVEFQSVVLGRELVVAAGLHDTWARKSPGTAHLEVWVGGAPAGRGMVMDNRSGWGLYRIDTSSRAGETVAVRFQITSPQPVLRHVAFSAEARR